jgi:hypothetical protein
MIRISFLLTCIILLGCNQGGTGNTAQVSARLDSLISEIQKNEELEKFFASMDKVAFLKPSDEGFSTIVTSLGTITVSLENVSPYANGSRVTLTLGNVTSATINRLKMKIDWGKTDEKGYTIDVSEKTKKFTAPNPIRPGYWNKVQVILEDIPPTDLGYVRVSDVEIGGINLSSGW